MLAIIFACHASLAVACFDCDAFQVKETNHSVKTHCDDRDSSDEEGSTQGQLSCCCFDNPVKNVSGIQINVIQSPVALLAVTGDSISINQIQPILDFSLKRYHPFSPLSGANPLALKQSFLI